jgi:hypothetical protein
VQAEGGRQTRSRAGSPLGGVLAAATLLAVAGPSARGAALLGLNQTGVVTRRGDEQLDTLPLPTPAQQRVVDRNVTVATNPRAPQEEHLGVDDVEGARSHRRDVQQGRRPPGSLGATLGGIAR